MWMALILGEGRLNTFDSILFCFDSVGLFCFGGCFGKTVYKLIFVVLVFKAKKQKQKPFGNCTVSLRQGRAAF
jgi:hypothetical protein